MGTILNKNESLKHLLYSLSPRSSFRKPYIISDPTVSPGWALAETTITCLLWGFPMVSNGIYLPSYVFPRLWIVSLLCESEINFIKCE